MSKNRLASLRLLFLRGPVMPAILRMLLSLSVFVIPPAGAVERITDFDVAIVVKSNGQLHITERITAVIERKQIKHGIYRDFPTQYTNRAGVVFTVPFEMQSVRRNGEPETWFVQGLSNGVRITAGGVDRFVAPGIHVYEFVYTSDRRISFLEDADELYWNVTGNDWLFPLEQVHASVSLPKSVLMNDVRVQAWSGKAGERGADFEALPYAHSGVSSAAPW